MYQQNIFNGVDRPDISQEISKEAKSKDNLAKERAAQGDINNLKVDNKEERPGDDKTKSRSRSRSRSQSRERYERKVKELAIAQKELEEKKKREENEETLKKEKEEAEKKILDEKLRAEKAQAVKERYMMRKSGKNTIDNNK
jgi:hypothetical protein